MERWRSVVGWPYEVSDKGRVRRTESGPRTRPGLVLKAGKYGGRYVRVQLSRNGVQKKFAVAGLVAVAFLPRMEGKDQINHKDGDTTNNAVENLEWVTQSENQLHAYDSGLQKAGSMAGRAKLTEEDVAEIRRRYTAGETQTSLAEVYPVNQSMISKIISGQFWKRTAPLPEK